MQVYHEINVHKKFIEIYHVGSFFKSLLQEIRWCNQFLIIIFGLGAMTFLIQKKDRICADVSYFGIYCMAFDLAAWVTGPDRKCGPDTRETAQFQEK